MFSFLRTSVCGAHPRLNLLAFAFYASYHFAVAPHRDPTDPCSPSHVVGMLEARAVGEGFEPPVALRPHLYSKQAP